MAYEAAETLLEISKLVVLPAVGFAAGFAAQWLLQERKSRDELLRALAEQRAAALCKLWEITTLPVEITALEPGAATPIHLRERLDRSIVEWYTKEAGALFLSWQSTHLLFRLLDLLRSEHTHRTELEGAVSSLRTRLKRDCGIYSSSEARRPLTRPRPAPWTDKPSNERSGPRRTHHEH